MNTKLIIMADATIDQIQSTNQQVLYELCPNFEKCSAPLCPLDKKHRKRTYRKFERTCFWARELLKPNGEARIRGALQTLAANLVVAHTLQHKLCNTPYFRSLTRFAKTRPKTNPMGNHENEPK